MNAMHRCLRILLTNSTNFCSRSFSTQPIREVKDLSNSSAIITRGVQVQGLFLHSCINSDTLDTKNVGMPGILNFMFEYMGARPLAKDSRIPKNTARVDLPEPFFP